MNERLKKIDILACFISRYKLDKLVINNNYNKNKLIDENFFIIDSNNLHTIKSHMYGFSVTMKGIITDNYYKKLGYYTEPDPQGAYIMIRKIGNKITINQDFSGCFGLYYFQNIKENYFALSNSFLLLEEYLIGRQNISINKDYANHFIISTLCSSSIQETLINEIIELPSNTVITITKFLFID